MARLNRVDLPTQNRLVQQCGAIGG